jgi:hypothetical protein
MKIRKSKQTWTVLMAGVLLSSLVVAPLVAHAAPGDSITGTTALTLTGDSGALILDSVPSFDWGSSTTTAAQSPVAIGGSGNLQVTDGRGGSSGYTVTAQASDMTSGSLQLPVQAMTMSTTGVTHLAGATNADILSAATVASGDVDSNGTLATTATTGTIQVANNAKTGTYNGTITYTITDGGL